MTGILSGSQRWEYDLVPWLSMQHDGCHCLNEKQSGQRINRLESCEADKPLNAKADGDRHSKMLETD